MNNREFYALKVKDVREELDGQAKTLMFDVPDHLKNLFQWQAGQHLCVRFVLNGKEVRRSYSISSPPTGDEPLRITVKRVKDGVVSHYINDTVKAGVTIDVMPPLGTFCLRTNIESRCTYYFFAAGSGITPLYAMLASVMQNEPHSVAHLLYGNRDESNVLLAEEIRDLAQRCPDRLTVHSVLSKPGWWSNDDYWRKGKIDAQAIAALIDEQPPYAQDVHYFSCGPGAMNATIKQALMGMDVPAERIHSESYGADVALDNTVAGVAATAKLSIAGAESSVAVAQGKTLLQAGLDAGVDLPYACQSGVCGACKATLTDGEVHMRARMALTDKMIDDGDILTCQSIALTPEVSVVYK